MPDTILKIVQSVPIPEVNSSKKNKSSFSKGHKRSPESIEKQRETMRKQYAAGERKAPMEGMSVTPETIRKRAITKRQNAIGHTRLEPRGNQIYRSIMTEAGYQYEHRVVMEEYLGRKLLTVEHVHHKNHDTLDNDINNLEVLINGEHTKLHAQERALLPRPWAVNFNQCILCNTTRLAHQSHGICTGCFPKFRFNKVEGMVYSPKKRSK